MEKKLSELLKLVISDCQLARYDKYQIIQKTKNRIFLENFIMMIL